MKKMIQEQQMDNKQYHIRWKGFSAQDYIDAYPVGIKNLKEYLNELLLQEEHCDDEDIEIYELTNIRVEIVPRVAKLVGI